MDYKCSKKNRLSVHRGEAKAVYYFSIFLFQTFKPIAVAEYPKNPNTISVEIP